MERTIITINGKQYDVTHFDTHPGGQKIFRKFNNSDCTEHFRILKHSFVATRMMKKYEIPSASKSWFWSLMWVPFGNFHKTYPSNSVNENCN